MGRPQFKHNELTILINNPMMIVVVLAEQS